MLEDEVVQPHQLEGLQMPFYSDPNVAVVDKETADNHGIPIHRPAMVREVLDVLSPGKGDRALDLTVGTGGHALAMAERLGARGFLLGLDRDKAALKVAKERLTESAPCKFRLFRCPFSKAEKAAQEVEVERYNVILADLGVGSHQLEDPSRGFSYESDHELDMRFNTSKGMSARDVVNSMPEEKLADIFYGLGEERYSRQIARAVCERREEQPIETPAELAEIVKKVAARKSDGRTWRIHPATRVMMALRIYVNREMEELEALLELLPQILARGGRVCILTYHSLEARRVKEAWKHQEEKGLLREFESSPLMPGDEEIEQNPRVRSCQLRAAEALTEGGLK